MSICVLESSDTRLVPDLYPDPQPVWDPFGIGLDLL